GARHRRHGIRARPARGLPRRRRGRAVGLERDRRGHPDRRSGARDLVGPDRGRVHRSPAHRGRGRAGDARRPSMSDTLAPTDAAPGTGATAGPLTAPRRRVVPLGWAQSGLAVLIGIALCFVVILVVADEPLTAFRAFVLGTFTNSYSFGTMLSIATILVLTG